MASQELNEDEFSEEIEGWGAEDEEEIASPPASTETIGEKYAKSQLRVVRETKDFKLDYLQEALKQDRYIINVAPDYQRRQRWSVRKRSLLIESFLMNIPIPPVFLFEKEYNEYEVVDGRQRLDTIREFLSNSFALTGLTYWGELNGMRFNKLPTVIQKGLMRRSLAAVVLLAETKSPSEDDFDVRTVLFHRLNTGGEKLNAQELRNALFPGEFNKLLIELARMDDFTKVWGIPRYTAEEEEKSSEVLAKNTLYRTMTDCELVLRFFAIRETILNKTTGSLSRLLDRSMLIHQNDSDEKLLELKSEFLSCLRDLTVIFDGKPFRLPNNNRLSRPLYDALMVAMSLHPQPHLMANKTEIQKRFLQAVQNEEQYDILVGRGNTMDAIRERIALASWILSGVTQ